MLILVCAYLQRSPFCLILETYLPNSRSLKHLQSCSSLLILNISGTSCSSSSPGVTWAGCWPSSAGFALTPGLRWAGSCSLSPPPSPSPASCSDWPGYTRHRSVVNNYSNRLLFMFICQLASTIQTSIVLTTFTILPVCRVDKGQLYVQTASYPLPLFK